MDRALPSMGFSRHEYWSGLPFLSPGDLLDPGTELMSLTSPASAGGFFTTSTAWEPRKSHWACIKQAFVSAFISLYKLVQWVQN